jgi:transcriptional regulator with GAF, ATPase, and Fis domain
MGKNQIGPEASDGSLGECLMAGNVRELQNLIERAVILTQGSELYAGLES